MYTCLAMKLSINITKKSRLKSALAGRACGAWERRHHQTPGCRCAAAAVPSRSPPGSALAHSRIGPVCGLACRNTSPRISPAVIRELRNRRGDAMRGLGYGSRIGRCLFSTHIVAPCFITFVRRVRSQNFEGGIDAPRFLVSMQEPFISSL